MKRFIKPSTINILGGMQDQIPQPDKDRTAEPTREPSRWEKIKVKAKNTWKTFVEVAQDIKDTIVPIITALGTFLAALAAFRNRNLHRERTTWSA